MKQNNNVGKTKERRVKYKGKLLSVCREQNNTMETKFSKSKQSQNKRANIEESKYSGKKNRLIL